MRYCKGSINLSRTRDYPLLQHVLRAEFISHRQLFDFMSLGFYEHSRRAFNNRVTRLVTHGLLVRETVPRTDDGHIYSIAEAGASELIGHGEYYLQGPTNIRNERQPHAMRHSLELNELHLALIRSRALLRWTPATEIRSHNELTRSGYAKDYDAIVRVRFPGCNEAMFALEYERTVKAKREYLDISSRIEDESKVNTFLYLVANHDVLSTISSFFQSSRRRVYFGLASEFMRQPLETTVRSAQPGRTLIFGAALRIGE